MDKVKEDYIKFRDNKIYFRTRLIALTEEGVFIGIFVHSPISINELPKNVPLVLKSGEKALLFTNS